MQSLVEDIKIYTIDKEHWLVLGDFIAKLLSDTIYVSTLENVASNEPNSVKIGDTLGLTKLVRLTDIINLLNILNVSELFAPKDVVTDKQTNILNKLSIWKENFKLRQQKHKK